MDKIRATFFRNDQELIRQYMQMDRLLSNSTYTKYQQFIKEKENKKCDVIDAEFEIINEKKNK